MASLTKRGKLWSVRFKVVEDGQFVYKRLSGFKLKGEAQSAYNEFMSGYEQPMDKPLDKSLTYDFLLNKYLEYKKSRIRESSFYDMEKNFIKHITPYFSGKDMWKIRKRDILDWQEQFNIKGYAYKYKCKMRGNLYSFYKFCNIYYEIPNILSSVEAFVDDREYKEMDFWSLDEFVSFVVNIEDIMWKTLFTTLYFTGLRIGELTALSDQDIDLVTEKLTVNKSLTRKTKEGAYKIGKTKNPQSNRVITLPKILLEQISLYFDWKHSNNIESTFLFGGDYPISEQTRARRLESYCKSANVKKIRTHDFRHSHASYLISLGTDILLISNRLGHGSVKETLDTYGHLYPSSEPQLMDKLNKATENIRICT